MVRVIMGAKGSGKTKQLIEMINRAASNEERQRRLRRDGQEAGL